MVVVHVKRSEADQFLAETTVTESNDALIRRLVRKTEFGNAPLTMRWARA